MKRGLLPLLFIASIHAIAANDFTCTENALTPSSKECNQYYICIQGENVLQECPDDLHFDSILKKCDFPDRAVCDLESSEESSEEDLIRKHDKTKEEHGKGSKEKPGKENDSKEKHSKEKHSKEKDSKEKHSKEKDSKEKPGKDSKEKPGKDSKEKPGKDSKEKPGKDSKEKPGKDSKEKPGKDSKEKPGKDSKEKPGKDSKEKPGKDSKEKPGKDSKEKPGKDSKEKPGKDSKEKPGKDSKEKPGKDSKEKPGKDSKEKPGKDSKEKPGKDVTSTTTRYSTISTTTEKVPTPTAEISTSEGVSDTTTITTEGSVSSKPECRANNPGEAEFAPHPDCNKYYVCLEDKLVEMNCPAGLHFNPHLNVCDYPESADCQGSAPTTAPATELPVSSQKPITTENPTTTEGVETPSKPNEKCRANNPGEAEFAPHPDCGKYYVCEGDALIEMSCPEGLHFNPALNVCDYPEDANCENSLPTEAPQSTEESAATETTEAVSTEGAVSTSTTAPVSSEGPIVTELPVSSEKPITTENPTTSFTEGAETPSKPNEKCRANNPGEAEFAPHPDCGKYYVCEGDALIEMNCPEGLHFNPALNVCDYPEDANCENSLPTEAPQSTEESAATETTEAVSTEGAVSTSTTAPVSSEGPIVTELPVSSEKPITTENPTTSFTEGAETPSKPNVNCRANNPGEAEFAPHPDCGKYYVCEGDALIEMNCPEGLHFNPALNVCDYPEDANCENSLPTEAPQSTEGSAATETTESVSTEGAVSTSTAVPVSSEGPIVTELPVSSENPITTENPTSSFTEGAETPSKPNENCRANNPGEAEFAPHPDCGKYYVCEGDALIEMSCPEGLHFNPALNVCDYPEDANCQNSLPTEAPQSTEGSAATETTEAVSISTESGVEMTNKPNGKCRANNPGEVEFAPHPDCGKYYVCEGDRLIEMSCPVGLHFNPDLNVCDYPEDANCQGTVSTQAPVSSEMPTTAESASNSPEEPATTTKPNGNCRANNPGEVEFAPHPDCGKYYVCESDRLIEMSCPVGLHFNPALNVCDYPEDAKCQGSSTQSPASTDDPSGSTSEPNKKCRANKPGEVEFAPHEDCSKYYVCIETNLIEMNCPEGLHFNKELNVCDEPEDANCQVFETSTTEESAPTAAPTTTPKQETETTTANPTTTNPTTANPTSTESNVHSTETPSNSQGTTEGEVVSPTGECRANNPGEVAFAPHPDCGKYFVCDNDRLIEMNCPAGLHFNPRLNVCDYPEDAKCGAASAQFEVST